MERSAFSRALGFLNYDPTAKWSALLAGVGSAILFVGLLLILTLYADLLVNKGEIPSYAHLPVREQQAFLSYLQAESEEDRGIRQQRYQEVLTNVWKAESGSTSKAAAPLWLALEKTEASYSGAVESDLSYLWYLTLPDLVEDLVGAEAAQQVRHSLEGHFKAYPPNKDAAVIKNLADQGALSLVVRSRSTFQGWLLSHLVHWNSWMWSGGSIKYLLGLFITALLLAVARTALLYLSDTRAAQAVINAITRLRRALYHHTYRLGTLAFRALGPTEAVSISTRHLEVIHDGLFTWLTVMWREPIKFGLLLLFALVVSFWLALAFLLFAFLVWVLGGQVAAHFRAQGRIAQQRSADQLSLLQESLMMMRLVKVYVMETFNQARVERQLAKYGNAQMQRHRGEAIYRPLFVLLGLIAALILLWVGGYVVLNDHLGVTSAIAMVTALVCMYWPLTTWLEHRRVWRRARHSARVLFEFLDRTGMVGQAVEAEFLQPMRQALEFDKVSLKEPGTNRLLLKEVSLTIQAGQRVALVGPEASEKYALVYLVPRFLDPGAGEIRIDGKGLRWVTLESLRTQMAIVLQHNLVFNDSVANNIGCGEPTFTLPRIIEAAKTAHAHQFIQKLPQGYETPIGEMGHVLQPGEQYRIALARALLRDPALFIIEEPPTPLDDDTKALVDDTLFRVLTGRTVLFLAHRLSTIRNCDQVLLLYQGRIEAMGDHRELLATSDLYRHLQYLEFNEFAGIISPKPAPAQATG